ncbi:Uncharacterised protein [Cedecea neteri]|uniref:Uncharacterized protein n=1 Tax=Cedecea neteri TaxID=158822 RepID=A0A2X2T3J5_9ENTR|nr:Uncharacterised protein [Cedecea neteri]
MNTATNLPVSLYFDAFGEKQNPAIVLLPGAGKPEHQLVSAFSASDWPTGGFYILRVDNRDCGLSPTLNHAGVPDLQVLSQGQSIPHRLYAAGDGGRRCPHGWTTPVFRRRTLLAALWAA